MSGLNKYLGQGNLVADPKAFGEEGNVARFTIAVNSGYGDRRSTAFVDCVAFGKTAQAIVKHFQKGREIVVEGRLDQDRWEDKEGNKRSKLQIVVENFHFTSGGSRSGESPPEEAPAEAASGGDNLF